MPALPRIVITPGEPAGIGPDITIALAQQSWAAELVVIGDPDLLLQRAQLLNLPLTLHTVELKAPSTTHISGTLKIIPCQLSAPVTAGVLNPANAQYVLRTLEIATDLCLTQQASALVTGPVHKSVMNNAGIQFSGHTEFLAERCGVKEVVMLFVTDQMKVALATTHLPLAAVPHAITKAKLTATLQLLHNELKKRFAISAPTILVCGLNPHAGEEGHLGREEIEVITPIIQTLQATGLNIIGPLPADTIFTEKNLRRADAILAMYHDQALPVVKFQGFDHAVNVTLGLPICRTSVDHGTALDLAGTGQASADSLIAAAQLAIQMQKSYCL